VSAPSRAHRRKGEQAAVEAGAELPTPLGAAGEHVCRCRGLMAAGVNAAQLTVAAASWPLARVGSRRSRVPVHARPLRRRSSRTRRAGPEPRPRPGAPGRAELRAQRLFDDDAQRQQARRVHQLGHLRAHSPLSSALAAYVRGGRGGCGAASRPAGSISTFTAQLTHLRAHSPVSSPTCGRTYPSARPPVGASTLQLAHPRAQSPSFTSALAARVWGGACGAARVWGGACGAARRISVRAGTAQEARSSGGLPAAGVLRGHMRGCGQQVRVARQGHVT